MTKVRVEREGGVVSLVMDDRPRPSMIDVETCHELNAALQEIATRGSDKVIILRSEGQVFSAGGNLAYIEATLSEPDRRLGPLIDIFHGTILALRAAPQPVVASIRGAVAAAGFSLAMACDLVVASNSARFVVGYPKIGAPCDGGLSFHLTRRLGRQRSTNLFLLVDSLSAEDARGLGLVDRLVADEALADETARVAATLLAHPLQAVREIKALLGTVADSGLESHLSLEKHAFLRCAATEDFAERVRAFNAPRTGANAKVSGL